MVFPTSGFGGTLQTSAYPKAALNKILYNKKFLEAARNKRAFYELAQMRSIPHGKNVGDTQEFTRMLPLAAIETALTEGTEPSDQDFYVQKQQVTLQEWGGFVKVSSAYNYATFDANNAELNDNLGEQAGDTLELRSRKLYHQKGSLLMRVDGDPGFQKHNLAVTAASSTTVFTLGGLAALFNDNDLIGAQITITDGAGYGETRTVSANTGSSGAVTVSSAFSTAPAASGNTSYVTLTIPTGLTATNKISFGGLKRAITRLEVLKAKSFNGFWRSVLSPLTKSDLMDDEKFEKLAVYHPSGKDAYFTGEVFDLLGIRFTTANVAYRCAAGTPATYSATGDIELVPIVGKNCFGEVKPDMNSIDIWYTKPEIAQPTMKMWGALSWKHMGVDAPLNACWGVSLACGYTKE